MTNATRFVTDPVCGMTIPAESTVVVEYRGNDYYFCDPACARAFSEAPDRWIPSPDPAAAEAPWPAPRGRRPDRRPPGEPSHGLWTAGRNSNQSH